MTIHQAICHQFSFRIDSFQLMNCALKISISIRFYVHLLHGTTGKTKMVQERKEVAHDHRQETEPGEP